MSETTSSLSDELERGVVNMALSPAPDGAEEEYRSRLAAAYTDDITWLTIGKELLEGTLPALNQQAKNLGTSVGWFWTIYTTTTSITAVLTTRSGGWLNWTLLAPIFTALIAFLLAVAAQNPVYAKVDLRSPDDIRRAVERSIRHKTRWMRACILALVATAVLIGVGVVIQLG